MAHATRQHDQIIPYRDRLLYLTKLMWEETDKTNPLTMEELSGILYTKFGREVTKRTISEDILAINQYLFHVGCIILPHSNEYGYYKEEVQHDPDRE